MGLVVDIWQKVRARNRFSRLSGVKEIRLGDIFWGSKLKPDDISINKKHTNKNRNSNNYPTNTDTMSGTQYLHVNSPA